jgi:transcriptional antiterminator RfaH
MSEAPPAIAAGLTWHVAQTQSFREALVAAELSKQGFSVFLPQYVKRIRHARRVAIAAAALVPGYVFVGFGSDARWRAINGTRGVVRLIMAGESPAPVAKGIVGGLIARRDARGYIPLPPRAEINLGDPVRVVGGSFADALGLFEEMRDGDRVAILLDLLGRKVRVVIDEALVEKAA